jgi:hypothetical protein
MDLMDDHWKVLEPLIGEMPKRADGRGRPWPLAAAVRVRCARAVLPSMLAG